METAEPIIGISGHLYIEIIDIEINKKYGCAKFGGCHNELCQDKRHFMLNPTPKESLCATEIKMLITNASQKATFKYYPFDFQMIDTNGISYKSSEQLCRYLQFGKYQYDSCDIQPNSQIQAIICFPQLEENLGVHKIYYNIDENRKIILDIAPLSEKAQRKLELLNKRKEIEEQKQLDEALRRHTLQTRQESVTTLNRLLVKLNELREDIFRRLNNYLTKNEKINLENRIMNSDFNIRKQTEGLCETYATEILRRLDDIMSDYRKRLVPANGNNTEVWERISNEGAREDLGETVFRSSWEANIARILNSKCINWSYETTPFTFDTIHYLPDFFLDDGTIIEVKGHWDNDSITKVEAFMRSNFETNYLIIDHDMYPDLTQIYADKIQNWEKVQVNKEKVNVVVVGLSFVPDKTVIENLQVGEVLQMELEPHNQYDRFAIAVKTVNGSMVGHIEKRFAPIYAQKLKLGMTFSLDIVSIEPKIIRAKAFRNNWEKPIIHSIFSNSEA